MRDGRRKKAVSYQLSELLPLGDHDTLAEAAIEVKKMLATLILKLKANG